MSRPKGSKNKRTLLREAARDLAKKRTSVLATTELPDLKASIDSLDVLEEVMRHFYIKAQVEKTLGDQTDWKAVDNALLQAAHAAEKVAAFKHAKLSSVRLAGDLNVRSTDGATLDQLLERIKTELGKLGPIIDMEVARDPEGIENRLPVRVEGASDGG